MCRLNGVECSPDNVENIHDPEIRKKVKEIIEIVGYFEEHRNYLSERCESTENREEFFESLTTLQSIAKPKYEKLKNDLRENHGIEVKTDIWLFDNE